ncbi:MAG: Smr/MutS family protein [Cytophagaceae bacterium]|nr:Smr/MutS family protein [Cytophagaceae bacterium]
MNIGDKVRLLHGKESGIVTRLLSGDLIEIEIEEGFKIPVQRRELALVSPEEAIRFKPGTPASAQLAPQRKQNPSTEIVANKGLYLAFVPLNDRELAQHVINNTDWDVPFALSAGSEPHLRGLATGVLKSRTAQKIQDLAVKDFETWGVFTFQALFSRGAFLTARPPLEKRLRFRINSFFNSKQKAPVLGQDAHLFQLDAEEVAPREMVEQLVEKRFEPAPTSAPVSLPPKPTETIDLHIEKLSKQALMMSPGEMLEVQLKTFETQLENAIAHAMPEIIFIHGIGNHTLRDELHRRLGKHPQVKFFQDAQKEKFGYGATRVSLK